MRQFDVVCVGIGPANLALAAALQEWKNPPKVLLIDASGEQGWHAGMQIPGALMQIHFLKDLVSLRNAASDFSIVNYLSATSRLEQFINTGRNRLTRLEFAGYLAWAENKLAFSVERGSKVTDMSRADQSSDLHVSISGVSGTETVRTRAVSLAIGGDPKLPSWYKDEWQAHSSSYLTRKSELLPEQNRDYRVAVVGGGQSGAEIALDLLSTFPNCHVDISTPDYSLRRSEDSPFMNESFDSKSWADFRKMEKDDRQLTLRALRSTNYGVVHEQTLKDLYEASLIGAEGKPRLSVLGSTRVVDADAHGLVYASMQEKHDTPYDAAFLATGYDRGLENGKFARLVSGLGPNVVHLGQKSDDRRGLGEHEIAEGVFALGTDEERFGIGDSLLSSVALRAGEIAARMRVLVHDDGGAAPAGSDYPPKVFLNINLASSLKVMRKFPLATFVTTGPDSSEVSQIPLVVTSEEGEPLRLFGHLDKNNPQVEQLRGLVKFVFSGPESYLSPQLFSGNNLPTWNYASVFGQGSVRILSDRASIVTGMQAVSKEGLLAANCEQFDARDDLDSTDSRIDLLTPHIVAFEIAQPSLQCRFKLSQDKPEHHKDIAIRAVASKAGVSYEWLKELSYVQ